MSDVVEELDLSARIQPIVGSGYYSILKYADMDNEYKAGCGDHMVNTHSFRQLNIMRNFFRTREEVADTLLKLTEFNSGVGYGAVWIRT